MSLHVLLSAEEVMWRGESDVILTSMEENDSMDVNDVQRNMAYENVKGMWL
jgi:hypothetical protein